MEAAGLFPGHHDCGPPRPRAPAIPEEVLSPSQPRPAPTQPTAPRPGRIQCLRPACWSGHGPGPLVIASEVPDRAAASHIKTGRLHAHTPRVGSDTHPFLSTPLPPCLTPSPSLVATKLFFVCFPSGSNVPVTNHGNEQTFLRVHLGYPQRPKPDPASTPRHADGSLRTFLGGQRLGGRG